MKVFLCSFYFRSHLFLKSRMRSKPSQISGFGKVKCPNQPGLKLSLHAMKTMLSSPYVGDLLGKTMTLLSTSTRINVVPDVKAATEKMSALGGKYADVLRSYSLDMDRCGAHTYRGWLG